MVSAGPSSSDDSSRTMTPPASPFAPFDPPSRIPRPRPRSNPTPRGPFVPAFTRSTWPANHSATRATSSRDGADSRLPRAKAISRGTTDAAIARANGLDAARSYAAALAMRQSRCALCVSTRPARSAAVMRRGFSFRAPFFERLDFFVPAAASSSSDSSSSNSNAHGSSPASTTSYTRWP